MARKGYRTFHQDTPPEAVEAFALLGQDDDTPDAAPTQRVWAGNGRGWQESDLEGLAVGPPARLFRRFRKLED